MTHFMRAVIFGSSVRSPTVLINVRHRNSAREYLNRNVKVIEIRSSI